MSDLQSSTQRELKVISFCEIIAARSTKCNNVFFPVLRPFTNGAINRKLKARKTAKSQLHTCMSHKYIHIHTYRRE